MNFHVGQKVVCIDDAFNIKLACDPRRGAIYEISRIENYGGKSYVALRGINPPRPWLDIYYAFRFRPAVEKKTDISIFKALLNPTPSKVSA